jgi:hypothetical protein
MLEMSDAIEPVYPAATVVLVRDGDAGYAQESLDAEGQRHRVYMINGHLEYIRQL